LYKNAPIYVLDEPTAALDPLIENDIYARFRDITERKTTFYITHRLASTHFCDRIIVLKNGGIEEMGSHRELMRENGYYAELYNMQAQYYTEDIKEK
jgi:ABC-type multidrug transport system fused ATPase/permease subunit